MEKDRLGAVQVLESNEYFIVFPRDSSLYLMSQDFSCDNRIVRTVPQ
jgi:hypothetical protein